MYSDSLPQKRACPVISLSDVPITKRFKGFQNQDETIYKHNKLNNDIKKEEIREIIPYFSLKSAENKGKIMLLEPKNRELIIEKRKIIENELRNYKEQINFYDREDCCDRNCSIYYE